MELLLPLLGFLALGACALILVLVVSGRKNRPDASAASPHSHTAARTPGSGSSPAEVTAQIDRLVSQGEKIQAIKLLRDTTGLGLKDAKDRIDAWQPGTAAPATSAITVVPARALIAESVATEIDRLVTEERAIEAIKLLREQSGLGLAESKRAIDTWVGAGPAEV